MWKLMSLVLRAFGLCVLIGTGAQARAASERADWLRSAFYDFHHPYAVQAADELAIKMDKMRASPFIFFRGTAFLFYRDLAAVPPPALCPEVVWLSGDAHLANLAASRNGEGKVIFAMSDFDEAALGPAEWDLRRMATSIVLAGRDNKLSDKAIAPAVNVFASAYLEQMTAFAGKQKARDFRLDKEATSGVVRDTLAEAVDKKRSKFLGKYLQATGEGREFLDRADLHKPQPQALRDMAEAMLDYQASLPAQTRHAAAYYAVKDVRRKLGSGVGSLGRMRYWVLIEGETSRVEDDLILEFKQAVPSSVSLASPAGEKVDSAAADPAQRVLKGLQAHAAVPDSSAGAARLGKISFYVREKSPFVEDFDPSLLDSGKKLSLAAGYAARALAQAHALSADQSRIARLAGADSRGLQQLLGKWAFDYAAQVELDWRSFVSGKGPYY